ncbi:MAG: ABC transporter permease subunit [Gemmatimonadota bacterium]
MARDVWTVFWKEWLEILDQFLRFRRGGWSIIIALLFLGVFLPLQIGPGWAMNGIMFFYWPFLTASMTSTIVADSIAGERERHTLETLLSMRLGDSAILTGKLLASITYGYAFALSNLLVGLVAVKLAFGDEAATMTVARFAALFVTIGAAASCISGLGVFVSLRAPTVRQAQQTFGIAMLAMMMLPALAIQVLPDRQQQALGDLARTLGAEGIAWRLSAILLALALVLILAAIGRFKRGSLALD